MRGVADEDDAAGSPLARQQAVELVHGATLQLDAVRVHPGG